MSESRGRKRKQSSEKHLEQELELLKTKFRKLQEQITSGASNASTEGNNNGDQASDADATDRSDSDVTSSGAAKPNQSPESVAKRIHKNESQRNSLPSKHNKALQVIISKNSSSTLDGMEDNISRIKPPSAAPLHSKDMTFNHQIINMQSQNVSKTELSVSMVSNINQVSIAQNHLYMPLNLPNNMRFKKLTNIPASSEFKGNILTNKPPLSHTNNIPPAMAERLQSVLRNGLPKEERFYLQEKYKIPNNCTLMNAPFLNSEVIPFMDEAARKRDSALFKYQEQLGSGMAAIAEGVSQASRSGDAGIRSAMEHIHRGLHLLADLHYDQTRLRRIVCTPVNSSLKSFLVDKLSHRYHSFEDINHLFKRDDTVFGRDTGYMIDRFFQKQ